MNQEVLLFDSDVDDPRIPGFRSGIAAFVRTTGRRVTLASATFADAAYLCRAHSGHIVGVIACYQERRSIEAVGSSGLPWVNLCETCWGAEHAVRYGGEGTRAASFFLDACGCRTLVFISRDQSAQAKRCAIEFRDRGHRAEVDVKLFIPRGGKRFAGRGVQMIELHQFMENAAPPIGVFCMDKLDASRTLFVARQQRIAVPERVSILALGDPGLLHAGHGDLVSLLSVNYQLQGRRAANHLVFGLEPEAPDGAVVLKPGGIIHRATTPARSDHDPLVQGAWQILQRDPALSPVAVASELGVSSRTLQGRFHSATGMPVVRAADRLRLEGAIRVMAQHDYSLDFVAGLAGYRNRQQLRRSAHRLAGNSATGLERYCREHGMKAALNLVARRAANGQSGRSA